MKSIHRRIRTAAVYLASWSIVIAVLLLKWTCRRKIHADPRPLLRANGVNYIYAALHAHQLCALLHGEAGTGSMVSRSLDGQMIVPSLQSMGVHVVRGSGSKHGGGTKGGRAAFEHLYDHVKSGKPGYFSVDGPQGPRGCVHIGVAALAARTGAVVLPIAPIPTRRWIFTEPGIECRFLIHFVRSMDILGSRCRSTKGNRQRVFESASNKA